MLRLKQRMSTPRELNDLKWCQQLKALMERRHTSMSDLANWQQLNEMSLQARAFACNLQAALFRERTCDSARTFRCYS